MKQDSARDGSASLRPENPSETLRSVATESLANGLRASAGFLPIAALAVATGGLTAAQGGYFPTSWGWAALGLILALEAWLLLSGKTDAGQLELILLVALAAYLGWVAISLSWSTDTAQTVLEIQRTLMLVLGCAASVALVRRESVATMYTALLATVSIVAGYGLATRLFPEQLGVADPLGMYRLSAPIGYWNGLGVFTAMGIVLAVGLAAARASGWVARGIAGASLVMLPVTLFFTFSRGALLAAGLGLLVLSALSTQRLRLAATTLVLAPLPLAGVILASRADALIRLHSSPGAAADEGRRLAVILVALMFAEIAIAVAGATVARRFHVSRPARTAFASALVIVGVGGVAAGFSQIGNPVRWTEGAYRSFLASDNEDNNAQLTQRLASLSGNGRGDVWKVAWHSYRAHPRTGTGAGTFERAWELNPSATFTVKDAHSLYLETLSELGPVGLALLAVALLVPLVGAFGARRHPLGPPLTAAYVAFLVHAGVDWDWELAGVTMTAALIGILVLATRRGGPARTVGFGARIAGMGVVIAAAVVVLVGLLGNTALAHAREARDASRNVEAQAQAVRARRLMPWAAEPWIVLAEAQYDEGDRSAARASLERAIELDDRDWRAWLELAIVSTGRSRSHALARAQQLYPAGREVVEVADELRRADG